VLGKVSYISAPFLTRINSINFQKSTMFKWLNGHLQKMLDIARRIELFNG